MKISGRWNHLLLALFFVLAPAWAEDGSSAKDLNRSAVAIIHNFESTYGGHVGVSTQVLKSGKVPLNYNGTKPFIPASNMKVVTTAVALETLGRDYRFETRLYGPGTTDDGVVKGNLVLKGAGDPTFFPPFVKSATSPFQGMATALTRSGIRRVDGDLIIDDSDFDRHFIANSYHDRYLLDSYAAPVGGLGVNRNVATVVLGPNGMSVEPSSGSLQLVNDVKLGGYNQIWAERPRGTDKVIVHGVAQPGATVTTTLTVNDPVRFAGSAFYRILQKNGISFTGSWKTVEEGKPADLKGMILLAKHRSPRLKELIEQTNTHSDNLLAQHIFRRLGATVVGFGNVQNSEAVIRDFFKRHNISDVGLKMVDGSGLSETDRIAPYQMVHVLKAMWQSENGQDFIDSLPCPGEGTMRSRLGGYSVRAKTGTLNNHSALSGYVVTAYGETVGFSILVNDVKDTWPAMELQDRLVSLIAGWNKPL